MQSNNINNSDKIIDHYLSKLLLSEDELNKNTEVLFDENKSNQEKRKAQKAIDLNQQAIERKNLADFKKQAFDLTNGVDNKRLMESELKIALFALNPSAQLITQGELSHVISNQFFSNDNKIKNNEKLSLIVQKNANHYFSMKFSTNNEGKLEIKISDSLYGKDGAQDVFNALENDESLRQFMQGCKGRYVENSRQPNGYSCGAHSLYNLDKMDGINFFDSPYNVGKEHIENYKEFEASLYQEVYLTTRASIIFEGMKQESIEQLKLPKETTIFDNIDNEVIRFYLKDAVKNATEKLKKTPVTQEIFDKTIKSFDNAIIENFASIINGTIISSEKDRRNTSNNNQNNVDVSHQNHNAGLMQNAVSENTSPNPSSHQLGGGNKRQAVSPLGGGGLNKE